MTFSKIFTCPHETKQSDSQVWACPIKRLSAGAPWRAETIFECRSRSENELSKGWALKNPANSASRNTEIPCTHMQLQSCISYSMLIAFIQAPSWIRRRLKEARMLKNYPCFWNKWSFALSRASIQHPAWRSKKMGFLGFLPERIWCIIELNTHQMNEKKI